MEQSIKQDLSFDIEIRTLEMDTVMIGCFIRNQKELTEELCQIAYGIRQQLKGNASNVGLLYYENQTNTIGISYDMYNNAYVFHDRDEDELLEFFCSIIRNLQRNIPVLH